LNKDHSADYNGYNQMPKLHFKPKKF